MKLRGERGKEAEMLALEYLAGKGFLLIERNWRVGHKEIDLIMKSTGNDPLDEVLHIIEVRSLSEPFLLMPSESVTRKKQKLVISAASGYVRKYKIECCTQFDIVSVIFKGNGEYLIDYIPDAFAPQW